MMEKLNKDEVQFFGTWIFKDKKIVADNVVGRIYELTENYLIKMCHDASGWDTLYKNPENNDYWELIYLDSNLQGGGAPSLKYLNDAAAELKYSIGTKI
jgi:hypothetical protein